MYLQCIMKKPKLLVKMLKQITYTTIKEINRMEMSQLAKKLR